VRAHPDPHKNITPRAPPRLGVNTRTVGEQRESGHAPRTVAGRDAVIDANGPPGHVSLDVKCVLRGHTTKLFIALFSTRFAPADLRHLSNLQHAHHLLLCSARCLVNLAGLFKSQGRQEEAWAMYVEGIKTMKASLPKNHPDIARSLCSLASLYKATKCFDQAQECFAEALQIMRRALPKDHVDTARVLNNLALLYVQALILALARTQTLVAVLQSCLVLLSHSCTRIQRVAMFWGFVALPHSNSLFVSLHAAHPATRHKVDARKPSRSCWRRSR
jgi:hypothetical protein